MFILATESDTAFTLIPIEGKGQGAVARRVLKKGDLVLAEPPLFAQGALCNTKSIELALARLPVAQQREYLHLANCHVGAMHPFLGIFKTNCLPLGNNSALTGENVDRGGIFLIASRFNSSCVPNHT